MPKKKLQSFMVYINFLLQKIQEQLLALLHKKQQGKIKVFKHNTEMFYVDDFMMTSKENDIVLNFNE